MSRTHAAGVGGVLLSENGVVASVLIFDPVGGFGNLASTSGEAWCDGLASVLFE